MTSRAVMLGGGGPVGRAWEAGVVAGSIERGVPPLRDAQLIVGTSAGAVVGALLATGSDLTPVADVGLRMGSMPPGLAPSREASVRAGLAGLAGASVHAAPMSEAESLARASLSRLPESAWPASFRATVVHAPSGRFRVLTADDDVPLVCAVAASSALPGVYPPIKLEGEPYVDGGLRSMLNADLAAGVDSVVVLSCFPLDTADEQDLNALRRDGAAVTVISPDERLLGKNFLDQQLVPLAYEIGRDQAATQAEDIASTQP